jgi:hypothetical protein
MTQTNDILNITPATAAASSGNWQEVEKLLAEGADLKSCNLFGQNALYFALIDGKFDLAAALYDAGARLDELAGNGNDHSILTDIAELRRTGRDIFSSSEKSLVQLCGNGSYKEAEKRIPDATAADCSAALDELIRNGKYLPEDNLALAEKLFQHGGKADVKLLQKYAALKPAQLRNPELYTSKMYDFVKLYQKEDI